MGEGAGARGAPRGALMSANACAQRWERGTAGVRDGVWPELGCSCLCLQVTVNHPTHTTPPPSSRPRLGAQRARVRHGPRASVPSPSLALPCPMGAAPHPCPTLQGQGPVHVQRVC